MEGEVVHKVLVVCCADEYEKSLEEREESPESDEERWNMLPPASERYAHHHRERYRQNIEEHAK